MADDVCMFDDCSLPGEFGLRYLIGEDEHEGRVCKRHHRLVAGPVPRVSIEIEEASDG